MNFVFSVAPTESYSFARQNRFIFFLSHLVLLREVTLKRDFVAISECSCTKIELSLTVQTLYCKTQDHDEITFTIFKKTLATCNFICNVQREQNDISMKRFFETIVLIWFQNCISIVTPLLTIDEVY